MVYIYGSVGFVAGFLAGLGIINLFLRSYSRRDLVENKSLRWTYGLAVWVFAGLGVWGGVWLYGKNLY